MLKSRLRRIANHVEPTINTEVEIRVVQPSLYEQEDRNDAFLLAKELFSATPFIQSNSLIYQFAKRIEEGFYDNLGSILEAKNNWDNWLYALNDFLNEDGVTCTSSVTIKESRLLLKKKIAGPNNLYTDKYTNDLYTNNYLDMNKDLNKEIQKSSPTEKENYISESFAIAKDLIYSLPIVPRYDLMAQLAQDIERGDFDDLGTIADAKKNWDAWLERARKILKARNIILS